MLLLVPGLHPPPDDPTFSVEGPAGTGRIVGYCTLPLQFSDTHKATTVDLGQGGLEDVILELDWEDGTEDLLPAADLVFPTRTNDGRTLHIVQDGRGHLILHYQSLGVPLQGLRVHRFERPAPDISALLARLELEGAADSGLYRPHPDPDAPARRPALLRGPLARDLPAGGPAPWLLLVHGTAGSTSEGFGPLAHPADWGRLTASYGDRILSFEHRSLSETLLRSASDLLRCLAPDMTLDVLSLSRGGMFVELLVHGPVPPATVRGLAARSRGLPGFDETRFVDAFMEFSRLWRMKRPKIRRLLRAGCAIAGIPLLQSGRTRFYGLLFASARLARGRKAPLPTLLKSLWLVLTQSESGEQPMGLPGMDDQRGDSPVLRLLADAGQTRPPFDSDLAVLAGDFEGGGPVARAIQRQAARLHGLPSEGDHDIVVPVARMVGGLRRTQALLFKVRGPGAHHFAYLSDDTTRDAALRWLTRPQGSPGPPCFAGLPGAFLDPFAPTGPIR